MPGTAWSLPFFKPGYAVDVVTLQIRVIAYAALVTGLSPATAELQVINPSDVFHEFSDEMRHAAEKEGKCPSDGRDAAWMNRRHACSW